jgi:hypothetical protein
VDEAILVKALDVRCTKALVGFLVRDTQTASRVD